MVEEWLALVILGCATATFGVMVGTGGGVIFVPMLLILFDFDPEIAAGTSLTLVALNSFAGTYTYTRLGFVDLRSGILFAAVAIPGSIVAPFAVAKVGGDLFRILFGLLLVVLAAQLLLRSYMPKRVKKPKRMRSFRSFIKERRIDTKRGQRFRYHFNEPLATSTNFAIGFRIRLLRYGRRLSENAFARGRVQLPGPRGCGDLGVRPLVLLDRRIGRSRLALARSMVPDGPVRGDWHPHRRTDRGAAGP